MDADAQGRVMRERARRLLAWGRRRPLLADAALAGTLALVLLSQALIRPSDRAVHVALTLAMTLPLTWRRRAPLAVFAAIALVALVKLLVAMPSVADVAMLFALYAVAVYERRRWVFPAAIATLEVGVLLTTLKFADVDPALAFVSLSAFVVATGALSIYARTRHEHVAMLTDRARRLEIERDQQAQLATAAERARIARELHDIVAHNLTVMIALADGARLTGHQAPEETEAAIDGIAASGRQALHEMRRLLGVLRDDDGPAEQLRPQPGLDQLAFLLEQVRGAGLPTTLTRIGEPRPLSPGVQLTVYRVVQEALTNTLKHAPAASRAEVRLEWDRHALAIEVTDDAPVAVTSGAPGGHGLAGMRERLAVFGADIEAGPLPRGGWRVRTRLPIGDEAATR
jgi:signal transduction histidine kinase